MFKFKSTQKKSIAMTKINPNVQDLCRRLTANNPAFTFLEIHVYILDYDEDLELVLEAAKKNKTVEKLRIDGYDPSTLSVRAAASLLSVAKATKR
jgi:penicillin-binding protein-related factor A (putative recombinase)